MILDNASFNSLCISFITHLRRFAANFGFCLCLQHTLFLMTEFHVYRQADFYIPKRYTILSVLGRGSYGVVCKAIDTKSRQPVPIAVKKITRVLSKEVLLKRAIRELKLMRFFRGHPNVRIFFPYRESFLTGYSLT